MGALLAALLLATTTTDARPAKKPTRDPRTIGLGKNCKKNSDCKHGAQRCVGPNGQGKTNFLEACYLLSTLRPLRAHKLAELVRIGSEQAACVSGRFELPGGVRQVEGEIGREGRSARVGGKPVPDPDELFGGLATLAFTPLDLAYQAAGRDSDALAEAGASLEARLLEALRRRLPRDRERGYTSVGPHADDLAISLGEMPARLYASQGQSRAIVLAFKIGEIENIRIVQGRAPLLLLDDVSSELDPSRNAWLMQYLAALNGQVVLTTTDPELVASSAVEEAVFQRVESGRITPEKPVFSQ